MNVLVENAGTICTALVLAVVVFFIVRKIIKDARAGRSLCGGSCASCGGRCHAHGCGLSSRHSKKASGETDIPR